MKNWALLCLWLCCSAPAMAHKASDSYLSLDPARLQGRWDIALRDLDYALGLDANGDGALTWGELRNMSDAVFAYAMQRLSVASAGRDCALQPGQLQVASHSDGNYAVLNFALSCPDLAGTWALDYRLFFDLDAQHRGLFSWAGSAGRPAIFGPDSQRQTFDVATEHSLWQVLASFAGEGAHHILIGYDHLLFLFSLLLPAGLAWDRTGWRAVGSWRAAALEVAAVVTAFTLAHSLTLSLTALHVIALPARCRSGHRRIGGAGGAEQYLPAVGAAPGLAGVRFRFDPWHGYRQRVIGYRQREQFANCGFAGLQPWRRGRTTGGRGASVSAGGIRRPFRRVSGFGHALELGGDCGAGLHLAGRAQSGDQFADFLSGFRCGERMLFGAIRAM